MWSPQSSHCAARKEDQEAKTHIKSLHAARTESQRHVHMPSFLSQRILGAEYQAAICHQNVVAFLYLHNHMAANVPAHNPHSLDATYLHIPGINKIR